MAREIEPTTVASVAYEAALPESALGLLDNLKNPLTLAAFTSHTLKTHEDVLYSRVRWAGHCANVFLDLCDWIELRIAMPHESIVH